MRKWKVYQKGNRFRIAEETRGGLFFFSDDNSTIFWESHTKETALTKAHILNNPVPIERWTVVEN